MTAKAREDGNVAAEREIIATVIDLGARLLEDEAATTHGSPRANGPCGYIAQPPMPVSDGS